VVVDVVVVTKRVTGTTVSGDRLVVIVVIILVMVALVIMVVGYNIALGVIPYTAA
jgi:hypothetical protein